MVRDGPLFEKNCIKRNRHWTSIREKAAVRSKSQTGNRNKKAYGQSVQAIDKKNTVIAKNGSSGNSTQNNDGEETKPDKGFSLFFNYRQRTAIWSDFRARADVRSAP